jgi:hypothetical protein
MKKMLNFALNPMVALGFSEAGSTLLQFQLFYFLISNSLVSGA